jgi:hypothetical protein
MSGRDAHRDPLLVRCQASDRWLQLSPRSEYDSLGLDDLIHLDVMTRDADGAPYKLCDLVLSRADMLHAIAAYGDPPFRRRSNEL